MERWLSIYLPIYIYDYATLAGVRSIPGVASLAGAGHAFTHKYNPPFTSTVHGASPFVKALVVSRLGIPSSNQNLSDHPRESLQRVHRLRERHGPGRRRVRHRAAGRHWRGPGVLYLGLDHVGRCRRRSRVCRFPTPFRGILDLGMCVTLIYR